MVTKANVTTHILAKWSLLNNSFGSSDVGLGPPCFVSIIRDESLSLPVCIYIYIYFFFVLIKFSVHKKKN